MGLNSGPVVAPRLPVWPNFVTAAPVCSGLEPTTDHAQRTLFLHAPHEITYHLPAGSFEYIYNKYIATTIADGLSGRSPPPLTFLAKLPDDHRETFEGEPLIGNGPTGRSGPRSVTGDVATTMTLHCRLIKNHPERPTVMFSRRDLPPLPRGRPTLRPLAASPGRPRRPPGPVRRDFCATWRAVAHFAQPNSRKRFSSVTSGRRGGVGGGGMGGTTGSGGYYSTTSGCSQRLGCPPPSRAGRTPIKPARKREAHPHPAQRPTARFPTA